MRQRCYSEMSQSIPDEDEQTKFALKMTQCPHPHKPCTYVHMLLHNSHICSSVHTNTTGKHTLLHIIMVSDNLPINMTKQQFNGYGQDSVSPGLISIQTYTRQRQERCPAKITQIAPVKALSTSQVCPKPSMEKYVSCYCTESEQCQTTYTGNNS